DRDAARAPRAERFVAEPRLATIEGAEELALPVTVDGHLVHERRTERLTACAAELLHALMEGAGAGPGQLFGAIVSACGATIRWSAGRTWRPAIPRRRWRASPARSGPARGRRSWCSRRCGWMRTA